MSGSGLVKCPHCVYHVATPCIGEAAAKACTEARVQQARDVTKLGEPVVLGAMQFHGQDALREEFFKTVDGLQGFVVDLWLYDIAAVLERHGYDMTVRRVR